MFRSRSSSARRSAGLFGPLGVVAVLSGALLLPSRGDGAPAAWRTAVAVTDLDDNVRVLPDGAKSFLMIYEDRQSDGQNKHVFPLLTKVRRPENADKVELVAVADVAEWNFWPAKKFVIAHIRGICRRERVTIWFDWAGAVRKILNLIPNQSALVLIDSAGQVRFSEQGPLSPEREAELRALLASLGANVD